MERNEVALRQAEQMPVIWTDEDKKLIKETVARGTTDSEFKLFLYTAMKYNLDPLVKQVWCVKYDKSPAAIFTGRDGFLSIAHRSGRFDGMQTEAIREEGKLIGAKCTVWRNDMSHPFVVDVPLSEYNTGRSNWAKMPETMIKKVAESQCLRRAFDVSGIYAPEEIDTEPIPSKNNSRRKHIQPVPQPEEPEGSKEPSVVIEELKASEEPEDPVVGQVLEYLFAVATDKSLDAAEFINSVEEFLLTQYKVRELADISSANWKAIYANRERLVSRVLAEQTVEEAAV